MLVPFDVSVSTEFNTGCKYDESARNHRNTALAGVAPDISTVIHIDVIEMG